MKGLGIIINFYASAQEFFIDEGLKLEYFEFEFIFNKSIEDHLFIWQVLVYSKELDNLSQKRV